jgi:hypothetical protein
MQGRPDKQNNPPWDREKSATSRRAALNGTSKLRTSQGTGKSPGVLSMTGEHRAIPQRPPNMPRVDTPPETSRAPRPQRRAPEARRTHRAIIILGSVVAIIVVFFVIIGSLLLGALSQSSGPAISAEGFLASLSSQNYDEAYSKYLGPAVQIRQNLDYFKQQAQEIDQKYGVIQDYSEVAGSAKVTDTTQTFTYKITRAKNPPYNLTITLQQDSQDNTWKVVDYGTTLGPTQS